MDHVGGAELRRASEEWHTLQLLRAPANCVGPGAEGQEASFCHALPSAHGISPGPPCPPTHRECCQLVLWALTNGDRPIRSKARHPPTRPP